MAALAGLAVALLILWMPVGLVEMVVASSGISEAVPAAAPPLGLKARLLMAGFAGLMAVCVIGFTRRDCAAPRLEDGKGRAHRVQGAYKMGFAFSKLTAMARGRTALDIGPDTEQDVPVLRRADAHPDAPSRPPIFASRDFDGLDIFPRTGSGGRVPVASRDPDHETVVPLGALAMPSAPEPLTEAELAQPAFLRPAGPFAGPTLAESHDSDDEGEGEAVSAAIETPRVAPQAMPVASAGPIRVAPLPLPSTHGLSIAELTDRLERGLTHRARPMVPPVAVGGVIADMPVAPAVPVRASVERDADEALRAALGALRAMTGQR